MTSKTRRVLSYPLLLAVVLAETWRDLRYK